MILLRCPLVPEIIHRTAGLPSLVKLESRHKTFALLERRKTHQKTIYYNNNFGEMKADIHLCHSKRMLSSLWRLMSRHSDLVNHLSFLSLKMFAYTDNLWRFCGFPICNNKF